MGKKVFLDDGYPEGGIYETRRLAIEAIPRLNNTTDTEIRNVDSKPSTVTLYEAKLIDDFGSIGEQIVKDTGSGEIDPETGMPSYRPEGNYLEAGSFNFGTAGTFQAQAEMIRLQRMEAKRERERKKQEKKEKGEAVEKGISGTYKFLKHMDLSKKAKIEGLTNKFDIGDEDDMQIFEKTEAEKLEGGGFHPFKGAKDRIQFTEEFDKKRGMTAADFAKLKDENPKLWKMMKKKGFTGDESSLNIGGTLEEDVSFGKDTGGIGVKGQNMITSDLAYKRPGVYDNQGGIGFQPTNFVKGAGSKSASLLETKSAEMNAMFDEDAKNFDADAEQMRTEVGEFPESFTTEEIREHVDKWRDRKDIGSTNAAYEEHYINEGYQEGGDFAPEVAVKKQVVEDMDPVYDTMEERALKIRNEDIKFMQDEYPGSKPGDLDDWYDRKGRFGSGDISSAADMTYEDTLEYMDSSSIEDTAAIIQETEVIDTASEVMDDVTDEIDAGSATDLVKNVGVGAMKNQIMDLGVNKLGEITGMEEETDTAYDIYKGGKAIKQGYDALKSAADVTKTVSTVADATKVVDATTKMAVSSGAGAVPGIGVATGLYAAFTGDSPEDQIAGSASAIGSALMFTPLAPAGVILTVGSTLWSLFS